MAYRQSLRAHPLSVTALEDRLTPAVTMRFDYRFDTTGFYDRPGVKESLQRAADQIAPQLQDSLAAINPSGGNSWTATTLNPVTNRTVSIPNLTVAADELVVFLTAGPIGSTELGIASSGGFSASGSASWLALVRGRGQAAGTDTGPWGGMIAFDDTTAWHFGAEQPPSNRFDFASVATHELMHLLGFGLDGPSYTRHLVGSTFVGPASVATHGGPVPMTGNPPDHVAAGVLSGGQESVMAEVIPAGARRSMTPLDFAFLKDIGWEIGTAPSRPATPTPTDSAAPVMAFQTGSAASTTSPIAATAASFAIGLGAGVQNTAFVYGSGPGAPTTIAAPFGPAFTGGVRVATADLNGDGVRDTVLATGPGIASRVIAYDGATGAVLADFAPFEGAFLGGVFVAAGDLDGDGRAEIIVTPDEGGGPRVVIFSGAGAMRASFFAFTDDPNFRGGARAAAGDLTGNGAADLAVAAGFGGGPRVALFDGRSALAGSASRLSGDFFAFEEGLRNGIYLAIADLNGDGRGDLIAGAGPGGGPRVTVYSGASLLNDLRAPLANLFAGPESNRGGVRVATTDRDADGVPDLLTGAGEGGDGAARIYSGVDLLAGGSRPLVTLSDPSWQLPGVFVG